MNALGKHLRFIIGTLPGWLSIIILAALVGIGLLLNFKYISDQQAIARVRSEITANLLALKLFKDSILVTLQVQGRLFRGALLLFLHSLRPVLVTIIPLLLLLIQMNMWYQSRPLHIGEETVVTVKVNGPVDSPMPPIVLQKTPAIEILAGPVRILSQREICWQIRVKKEGYQALVFRDKDHEFRKILAAGRGFMRINPVRPDWSWSKVLLYPDEAPFAEDSTVQSINIVYPERVSYVCGDDYWAFFFFVVSIIVALLLKNIINVNL